MFVLLVAYVQGRGGVLDDRGRVIDTEMHGEWDPDAEDVLEYDKNSADVVGSVEPESKAHRVFVVCWAIGSFLVGILSVLIGVYVIWNLSGWLGHVLFGVPGAFGNVVGLLAAILGFLSFLFLSSRLENAKRSVRAGHGRRSLDDCIDIFQLVDQSNRCGACAFLVRYLSRETDGCVQCPECGGAWNQSLWVGFLRTDRVGLLKNLRMKQRRRSCQFDARRQMMRVMLNRDENDRNKQIRSCRAQMAFWDVLLFILILSILGGAALGAGYFAMHYGTDTSGIISAIFAFAVLLAVTIIAVMALSNGVWIRRTKRFIRDRIDERICPTCEEPLGCEPHPLDGALVCDGCGLAWDPATDRRQHHSRKRVPDEKYKEDPVFLDFAE